MDSCSCGNNGYLTFMGGFGTGEAFCQKRDLSGMVRFVFADVEPFPVDVYFFFVKLLGLTV